MDAMCLLSCLPDVLQVKKPEVSWHDAKKALKRDVRWDVVAASVESTERETMFQTHIRAMNEKKRTAFRKLLDETLQVFCNSYK